MKSKQTNPIIPSVLLAIMLLCLTTAAQVGSTDGGFDLSWHTIDGGGGASGGSGYELAGTIGQPDANATAITGGSYSLSGGFWPGAVPGPVDTCPADVAPFPAGDGLVNVNDLLAVINGWGPCPSPPATCPADLTNDNAVNVNDLLAVINAWGQCP